MKAVPKIPTRRSIVCRAWRYMERSWIPAIAVTVFFFAAVAAANWGNT